MTGRDLIIYIMANNLEDEPVVKDGKLIGFSTIDETAVKLEVGVAVIRAWIKQGILDCIKINDTIYIPNDYEWLNAKLALISAGLERGRKQ